MKLTYNSTTGGLIIEATASSPQLMTKERVMLSGFPCEETALSIMLVTPGHKIVGGGILTKTDSGDYLGILHSQTTECQLWRDEIGTQIPRPPAYLVIGSVVDEQLIYQPVHCIWNLMNLNAATEPIPLPTYITTDMFADILSLNPQNSLGETKDKVGAIIERLKGITA